MYYLFQIILLTLLELTLNLSIAFDTAVPGKKG